MAAESLLQYVPIPPGAELIVCDTGVKRALAGSEYNRRREECNDGVRLLSAKLPGITPAKVFARFRIGEGLEYLYEAKERGLGTIIALPTRERARVVTERLRDTDRGKRPGERLFARRRFEAAAPAREGQAPAEVDQREVFRAEAAREMGHEGSGYIRVGLERGAE